MLTLVALKRLPLGEDSLPLFALDSSRRQITDYGGSLLSDLGKDYIFVQLLIYLLMKLEHYRLF
jgi:hypothetical protein